MESLMPLDLRMRVEHWPLSRPFRISRGVKTSADVVVVEVHSADGRTVGRGEAVPYGRYGETPASVMGQLESLQASLAQFSSREALHQHLTAGAARNAVDCALWDLEAQISGCSVARKLGQSPVMPLTTAVTIGLDEPDAMAEAATSAATAALIKIKVDAKAPERQIQAVLSACPRSEIIVDPNESWTDEILRELRPFLVEHRVALLEQPLPAGQEHLLEGLNYPVPICADESCHTSVDLHQLVGQFQYVNIKLDKTGGLTEALELLSRAQALGFGIMVGCMICTSLSIAPALHVARHARFVDIDGPFWLTRDRPGGIQLADQQVMPPAPGFWGAN